MSTHFAIYLEPFYNSTLQIYQEIATLDMQPPSPSPLGNRVKNISFPKLSPFSKERGCVYVILELEKDEQYVTRDTLPKLFSFLIDHDYTINTKVTNVLNRNYKKELVAFISHY